MFAVNVQQKINFVLQLVHPLVDSKIGRVRTRVHFLRIQTWTGRARGTRSRENLFKEDRKFRIYLNAIMPLMNAFILVKRLCRLNKSFLH